MVDCGICADTGELAARAKTANADASVLFTLAPFFDR